MRWILWVLALVIGTSYACGAAGEIWVATDGADENSGTRERPMLTLAAALRQAREWRRLNDASAAEGVRIVLRGGVHRLAVPVLMRPEDSGTEKAPTILEAAPGEEPVLSGGVPLGGWRELEPGETRFPEAARIHIRVTDAPLFHGRVLEFRQLWIDGRKAVRAREPDGGDMERLLAWDRTNEIAAVPAAVFGPQPPRDLYGVEMTILQQWEIAHLRLKSLRVEGDKAWTTFHDPESRIQFEHPWPQPVMSSSGNSPFFVAAAPEFLDQPGEWYQEPRSGRVYLWPPDGVDMSRAEIIAPAVETLVQVSGTVDRPVTHVQFRGIGFAHTTWLRPSRQGHVPHQATMFMLDAYQLDPRGTADWRSLDNQAWIGRSPAAVTVAGTRHVRFERCRFAHTAIGGLDLVTAVSDSQIEGCTFTDIGGNGIQMGNYGDAGIEIHLPYQPVDERVVCTGNRIANNLLRDIANEDWGGVAISVGWAREVTIEHNEILDTSYSGISVGWGWTRTPNTARRHTVRANRIHRFATRAADCAGIYLLSAQPGSIVSGNVIEAPLIGRWVHDPTHWGYIYLDEGSSFTTVRDNWCAAEKYIKNANGPGNVWENNGPTIGDEIRQAAGLEPAFRDLLER